MIDLRIEPTLVALRCSDCGKEWHIDETQPFVAQLRLVVFGHTCPPLANVIDVRDVHRHHARRP